MVELKTKESDASIKQFINKIEDVKKSFQTIKKLI